MEVVGAGTGRTLKRTVSLTKKPRAKRTKRSVPVSPGLRRYLSLRGTPEGVYEISRMVNASVIQITEGGWNNGATITRNLCFVFTPQYLRVYNDTSSTVWAQYAIPNAAEFSALFDDVKIDYVDLTFMGIYTQHSSNITAAYQSIQPVIYGTDDNDTLTTQAIVEQLGDSKVWYPNNGSGGVMTVRVYPKYNQIVYYTSVLNGYQPARGYIRSDYDIEHYGLKMSMPVTSSSSYGTMNVSAKFHFKFKNLK